MDASAFQIIPSVLELRNLDKALDSGAEYVLLTNTHIGNLAAFSKRIREYDKKVLVHLESIGGFKPDAAGMQLLRNQFGVSGIFSSSQSALARGRRNGLLCFCRVFLMDSKAVKTMLTNLQGTAFDGLELLPSPVAVHYVDQFREAVQAQEIFAGGFVTPDNIAEIRQAGFDGVTTSSVSLWPTANEGN